MKSKRFLVAAVGALMSGAVVVSGGLPATAADGALDRSFGTGGKVTTILTDSQSAWATAEQSDGKLVVAGYAATEGNKDFAVVRYTKAGALDTTFDTDGKVTTSLGAGNDRADGIAIQSDGKIVVVGFTEGGDDEQVAVVRYNANGSLDTTFDTDGIATAGIAGSDAEGSEVALQPDGKIVVAGSAYGASAEAILLRFNTDGSPDTSFDADGLVTKRLTSLDTEANSVALQDDGRIVVVGTVDSGPNRDVLLLRYNTNGSPDTSFGTIGIVTSGVGTGNDYGTDIAVQPDGKLVVAGTTALTNPDTDVAVLRFNADGSPDTTFDTDGMVTTSVGDYADVAFAVALQVDGKIVVGGNSNGSAGAAPKRVIAVRYATTGALDTSFGTGGKVTTQVSGDDNSSGNDIVVLQSGAIAVAGSAYNNTATPTFAVVRYTGTKAVPRITAVSPSSGPIVGGTRLTVSGAGFATSGTVKVTVGGKACTAVTVLNDHTLTCSSPAVSAGAKAIKVTNPNRASGTKNGAFTYRSVLARPRTYWTQQFGGSGDDEPSAVISGPGGDIWVYGKTKSALDGTLHGASDLFLARYSKSGTLRWLHQFGTDGADTPSQHLVVLPTGEALLTGSTTGAWPSETRKGSGSDEDLFVAKTSASGALLWAHQYGTNTKDYGRSIARSPSGDLYVVVETNDAFPSGTLPANTHGGDTDAGVMKLTKDGTMVWTRQFGGPAYDAAWDVAVSTRGEMYLVGTTYGDLDGPSGTLCNRPTTPSPTVGCHAVAGASDPFLVRFDAKGAVVWALQTSYTGGEETWGVAAGPNGDVYIDGYVYNEFIGTVGTTEKQGKTDSFVSRYTKNGVLVWTHQHGTSETDNEWNISVGPGGQVYTAGYTNGTFSGWQNQGNNDAYVFTLSADGKDSSVQQFSTPMDEEYNTFGSPLAIARGGGLVLANRSNGTTWGALPFAGYDVSLTFLPIPGANKGVSSSQWYAQLGSDGEDLVAAVQTDSKNNTYVLGQTTGVIEPGHPAPTGGGTDAYLAKYGPSGDLLWVRQFGSDKDEYPGTQIFINKTGDVYVEGITLGALPGQTPGGKDDAFVAKFSKNGALLWAKQYGTTEQDQAWGLAGSPSGDVYVAIETYGAFPSGSLPANTHVASWDSVLMKLDRNGTLQWAAQFGEAGNDAAWTALVNSKGEPYLLGTTNGPIGDKSTSGANDGFIAKFDKNGNRQWLNFYGGTSEDAFWGGGMDRNGNIYATGLSEGDLGTVGSTTTNQGLADAIVVKISPDGTQQWVHQTGTSGYDLSQNVVVTKDGWIYASGTTAGALGAYSQLGNGDVYVEAISPDGTTSRVRQFGTATEDGTGTYALPLTLRPNGTLVIGSQSSRSPWGGGDAPLRDAAITAITLP